MNISKTTFKFPQSPPAKWVRPECNSLAEVKQAELDKVKFEKKYDKAWQKYSDYKTAQGIVDGISGYGEAVAKFDQGPQDWASKKEGVVVLKDTPYARPVGISRWDYQKIDAEMNKNGDFTVFVQGDARSAQGHTFKHTTTPTGDRYDCIVGNKVDTVIVNSKKGTMTHIEETRQA